MTVIELIERLKQFDPNLIVEIHTPELIYDNIFDIQREYDRVEIEVE